MKHYTSMAPAYTELARQAPAFKAQGMGLITAFTDGGHQFRYWLYALYQAQWWAIAVLPLVGAGIFFTRRRFAAMVK